MAFTNAGDGGRLIISVKLPSDALHEVKEAFEWSAMSGQPHVEMTFHIEGVDHTQRKGIPVRSFVVSSMIQLSKTYCLVR